MQSCAVSRCIGTVVSTNRPVCNLGLVLQSLTERTIALVHGGWNVFTETYEHVMDLTLENNSPKDRINIEWVDDAFYGYVCSAKNTVGHATGILTSSIGGALIENYRDTSTDNDHVDAGGKKIDSIFSAEVSMVR